MSFHFKPNKRRASDGGISAFTNDEKADHANEAIDTYRRLHRTSRNNDGEDQIHLNDLMTDLRHYCDRKKLDFNYAISNSEMHWRHER